MNYLFIFILTAGALIGGLSVFFVKQENTYRLKLILSFSGAYLFGITVLHLLPDVYESHNHYVGLFILAGFILQILLEQFSQGIEHGHIHAHNHGSAFPWGIMISLCLHAFLEGMPLTTKEQNHLVFGIAIHHIPAAFALGSVLLSNHVSKSKTIVLLIVFALMAPLGYIFSYSLKSGSLINTAYYQYIMGIVIGIFLHISTTILFEASVDHKFSIKKTIAVIAGTLIALSGFLLHQH
ncbi:zinc/iron permease [Pseudopedobacter saltans DSM 12145]|uniref:Zinc/iron permease n=1 Tax=Pseudopedobacter saltans (strain ATCC 51119 / DSM 12145 / JCM 21818 / CCUG 39354 / LMG 10337 / NBRC 100064 / NCIMB 13643) TaxID=762903 RepID=F0SAK9_PSESL|nr:ZIP family metal transporter [Pseudopedobacter saltans]ADY52629.1 zinc/iron permease [Pseudopedobacter saltans DSM 12145]